MTTTLKFFADNDHQYIDIHHTKTLTEIKLMQYSEVEITV